MMTLGELLRKLRGNRSQQDITTADIDPLPFDDLPEPMSEAEYIQHLTDQYYINKGRCGQQTIPDVRRRL